MPIYRQIRPPYAAQHETMRDRERERERRTYKQRGKERRRLRARKRDTESECRRLLHLEESQNSFSLANIALKCLKLLEGLE